MKDKKQRKNKEDLKGYSECSDLIQKSINTSMKKKEEWTDRNKFLFKQRERLNEIWEMWRNAEDFVLNGFLVFQSYRYREEMNVEKLIERIKSEVEVNENKELEKYQNAEKFIIQLLDKLEQNQDLELKTSAEKVARFFALNLEKIFNIMVIRHQQQENYKENVLLLQRQEHFIKYNWKKKIFILSAIFDGITYSEEFNLKMITEDYDLEEYLNSLLVAITGKIMNNKKKYE